MARSAMYRAIALFLLLSMEISAQTRLSGSIGNITLDSTGNPYLITDNLKIAPGKTLTIDAGCVFLFQPYTGIIVEGAIEVFGTKENPVAFSSANDPKYNPKTSLVANPFDWNGILVTESAEDAWFSDFLISYSVYGLKSQSEKIGVQNGVFYQNGQFNFTIHDRILKVQEGFPFSHTKRAEKKDANRTDKKIIRKIAPVAIGGIGLVSGVLSGVSIVGWNNAKTDYEQTTKLSEQQNLKAEGRRQSAKAFVFGGICAAAMPVAIVMQVRKRGSTVSAAPVFGSGATGVLFTFRF